MSKMKTADVVLTSDTSQVDWMNGEGHLWKDDDLQFEVSDVFPLLTARGQLISIEYYLDAGLLDEAESLLMESNSPLLDPIQVPQWQTRLSAANKRLAVGRVYEAHHGIGSTYAAHHPLAILERNSDILHRENHKRQISPKILGAEICY